MKTLLVALALVSASSTAFAGNIAATSAEAPIMMAQMATPASPDYDWTGPYAGANLGYGRGKASSSDTTRSGFGAAVHFGYNRDLGNWVAGAEVDFAPAALANQSAGERELGNVARLKLRAGPKFGATGNTFAFGTLGFGHAQSSDASNSYSDTSVLAGVGLSHAIRSNMFVTGEVIHQRVNDLDGTDGIDAQGTDATIGLSLRF